MKLFQLATEDTGQEWNDGAPIRSRTGYGPKAGWWLVVSDDLEDELAGPFPTREQAQAYILEDEGGRGT